MMLLRAAPTTPEPQRLPEAKPPAVIQSGLPIADVLARLAARHATHPHAEVRRGRPTGGRSGRSKAVNRQTFPEMTVQPSSVHLIACDEAHEAKYTHGSGVPTWPGRRRESWSRGISR
jgi:hypothetical protein